jgi:PhnB protein
MKLHTYLNYGGNCREAFQFYEQHLGGKITFLMTQAEAPGATNVPPERANDILYANMTLGKTQLMASDVPPEVNYQPMRSAYLSLSVETAEDAQRIYKVLSEGGEIFMPLQETFFAFHFAMVRDRFGANWMIVHERPMPS